MPPVGVPAAPSAGFVSKGYNRKPRGRADSGAEGFCHAIRADPLQGHEMGAAVPGTSSRLHCPEIREGHPSPGARQPFQNALGAVPLLSPWPDREPHVHAWTSHRRGACGCMTRLEWPALSHTGLVGLCPGPVGRAATRPATRGASQSPPPCCKPVSFPVHQNYVGNDAEKSPFFLSVTLSDQNNQRVPQYRAILWRKTVSSRLCTCSSSAARPLSL